MATPLERLRALVADRYAIERELGRGGMATVYLATDIRHERQVAIKVLLPDLAATIGAERFEREIRLAARLQHPHILGLHDSGHADDLLYYVMPFVDGESVRDRLDREKQLPVDDAIRIALEVADALGYAHAQGIIHRDIKPENVMLSNGHALVADFGIARARTEAGQNKLTQTGMAMGTPVYMSPEQFTGEEVGPTADIYSLGCMLFEMLAGEPPFTGKNSTAIMAKHAMEAVPSIRIVRSSTPEEVEETILAAMEKSPADRPRTAAEFCEMLGTPMGATSTRRVTMRMTTQRRMPSGAQPLPPAKPRWRKPLLLSAAAVVLAAGAFGAFRLLPRSSAAANTDPLARKVAVRYFNVVGGNASELQPAAERLTESLIHELSTVRVLSVVSPNGVAQFRSDTIARDSVARALKVGTMVEGTIEPEGKDELRITFRLYDVSGANLGSSHTLKVKRNALFKAEESVARKVSEALREVIGPEIQVREAQAATRNIAAWTLFNRAEAARKRAIGPDAANTPRAIETLRAADSLLMLAQSADPRWIEPTLQRIQVALDGSRLLAEAQVGPHLDSALALVNAAFAVDANSAKALELRGTIRHKQWQAGRRTLEPLVRDALLTNAEDDLLGAIRKDDRLVTAYATLSELYFDKKDVPASLLKAQTAYQADEFLSNSRDILARLFLGSYNTQAFADAQRWCDEGARRYPASLAFTRCYLLLQLAPDATPDPAKAWALAARIDSLAPPAVRAFQIGFARMLVGGVIGRHALTLPSGVPRDRMLDSARAVLERSQPDRTVDPTQELAGYRAVSLAQFGDIDAAITMLTSYVAANPDHSFRVGGNVHWWWRDLRSKRSFEALLARTR